MDCGFEVFIDEKCDSYPRRREVTAVVDCLVFINVLWWIVGLPAHGVFLRDGFTCRCESTAVVDCRVDQFAVMDCLFDVFTGKKCYSYPSRREATAVWDCNVDQSAVLECDLTGVWGIAALW